MHLYHTTLNPPTFITCCVVGNFSGTGKSLELCAARGSFLEMSRLDTKVGALTSLCTYPTFSIIRSLETIRLPGTQKDLLIVGTDSGAITLLAFEDGEFQRVQSEIFGKSGCRRVIAGEYIATDPRGRAIMIAAIERQKFVYVLQRESALQTSLGSPLEHHRSNTVCNFLCGLDVGFENPVFAALESTYDQPESKSIVYYELDLGLNHVTKKWAAPVSPNSSYLIPLIGGRDGPSGVLVCCEYYITYVHENAPTLRVPIPRRLDPAFLNKPEATQDAEILKMNKGFHIIAHIVHKMKALCFILVQTEQGDLFRVDMTFEPAPEHSKGLKSLSIQYYDTIPPAVQLRVFKAGFLFAASDSGNHSLFHVQGLGGEDDEDQLIYDSGDFEQGPIGTVNDAVVYFRLRELSNLVRVQEIVNLAPVLQANVVDQKSLVPVMPNDVKAGLYAISGKGHMSEMRFLQLGRSVTELAVTELPGQPTGIWTLQENYGDLFHRFIVISFANSTLVLQVDESVEEVTDSGLLDSVETLAVYQLRNSSVVQVHREGILHISKGTVLEQIPLNIASVCSNGSELFATLQSGSLVRYELSGESLVQSAPPTELPSELLVTALAVPPLPKTRKRARFLAVLCHGDNTVRTLSLAPDSYLATISVQTGVDRFSCICYLQDTLWVGTDVGLLQRITVEPLSGKLGATQSRYLGANAIDKFAAGRSREDMLILSQSPWVLTDKQLLPLQSEPFVAAAGFRTEQCPFHGFVAVSKSQLRIFSVEKHLDKLAVVRQVRLGYTPRRVVFEPHLKHGIRAIVATSELNTLDPVARQQLVQSVQQQMAQDPQFGKAADAIDPSMFGNSFHSGGTASSLLVHDCSTLELAGEQVLHRPGFLVTDVQLCTLTYESEQRDISCLVVGVRRSVAEGALLVFKVVGDGFELLHETATGSETPLALCPYVGLSRSHRLLVGLSTKLRIYSLGRKQLLRKSELGPFPSPIVALERLDEKRVACATLRDSVYLMTLDELQSKMYVTVEDSLPRWCVSLKVVDGRTVAVSDKFGNIIVLRASSEAVGSGVAAKEQANVLILPEAPYKWSCIAHFYIGDTAMKLFKTILVHGGRTALVYVGILGSVGCLLPIESKGDVELLQQLQQFVSDNAELPVPDTPSRAVGPGLVMRSFEKYRGYYQPMCGVVDGDFCDLFFSLSVELQEKFCKQVDVSSAALIKRLEHLKYQATY